MRGEGRKRGWGAGQAEEEETGDWYRPDCQSTESLPSSSSLCTIPCLEEQVRGGEGEGEEGEGKKKEKEREGQRDEKRVPSRKERVRLVRKIWSEASGVMISLP